MKFITAILLLSLNVSANVYSQNVNLTASKAPLHEVLQKVRRQTGYYFFYPTDILKNAKPVTVQLTNANINDALKEIMKDQPFVYDIQEKGIMIKLKMPPERNLMDRMIDVFKAITIRGKVIDEDGNPLPGASVKVGKKTAVTNVTGDFYFEDVNETDVLEVSYVGYKNASVAVSKNFLTIRLLPDTSDLKEVVVNKGYYDIKKELNTGSTYTFSAKDMEKQPVNNLLSALEGNVPGLEITQTTGVPGSEVRVSLRGLNSIANGTDPLYIVDGVQFSSKNFGGGAGVNLSSFPSLRPEDIEKIDILKDADATAIYGSRGANGVILITTKKGRVGKTRVEANVYSGWSAVPRRLDLMNTPEYLQMRREALKNDGLTPEIWETDINGTWDTTRYVDWQEEMFGRTAKTINASTNLSGGNEQTQFLVGFSYRKETTVFPGDYANRVASGLFNLNHKSENNRFNATFNINYSINANKLPQNDFTRYIFSAPNSPKFYNDDDTYNWENSTWLNPLAETEISSTTTLRNLVSSTALSYRILPGLRISANAGYNVNSGEYKTLIPFTAADPAVWLTPSDFRRNDRSLSEIRTWIVEPQLNFTKNIGDHHLDALVGGTFQETIQETSGLSVGGFSSDALITNSAAGTVVASRAFSNIQYRYNALYARIGYNYREKYVLNLTGRRDGSSRFGPGRQFGNFGAIGVAWLFNKESFISENLSFLSTGKFRASIGKTGNDQLTDYQYLSIYNPQGGFSYGGIGLLRPENLSNPTYGWETINKKEIGLELGVNDNKILFNASYFRHRTANQLVGYPLPGITGFQTVIANLPAIIQNSGFEMDMTSINFATGKFKWQTTANFTLPRNKLVKYPNIEGSPYSTRYAVGFPLTMQFGYVYSGINQETGIYQFADLDKSGTITSGIDRRPVFYDTKFSGGLTNTISYSDFSLDFMFHYARIYGFSGKFYGVPGAMNANQPKAVLDRWTAPNSPGKFQRYTSVGDEAGNAASKYEGSDAAVTNNEFLRLRNVMLSWTPTGRKLSAIGLRSISFYLQGQNVFVVSKFKGLDPETSRKGAVASLPPLRTFTIGMKVSL